MTDAPPEYRTPLWVKVFGTILIIVVLLFLITLLTRGPHRGPGGHGMMQGFGGHAPSGSPDR